MIVKGMVDEDFVNYKKPSMLIAFSKCSFKCGKGLCQNSPLATSKDIYITTDAIIKRYIENNLTNAICCAGLDPIDTFEQLVDLVKSFRKNIDDDIVIYTGYYKHEIEDKIKELSKYKNIVVKFGRYLPNQEKHFDKVLGVDLASDNQYAEKIS